MCVHLVNKLKKVLHNWNYILPVLSSPFFLFPLPHFPSISRPFNMINNGPGTNIQQFFHLSLFISPAEQVEYIQRSHKKSEFVKLH